MNSGQLKRMDHFILDALGADRECAAQLGDALRRHAGLGILVHFELDNFLLLLDRHCNDLVHKFAGSLGSLSLLLGSSSESVLLFAGDAPDIIDIFSSGAHVVVVVSFPQAVLDHGIHHLGVAHAGAVAAGRNGVGRCGHVLGTRRRQRYWHRRP